MRIIHLLVPLLLLAGAGPVAADGAALAPERAEIEGPASARILVVEAPAVEGDAYAIHGRVAYEGVEGEGYLEMWSVFPDGSRYFSRTLEEHNQAVRRYLARRRQQEKD